MENEKLLDNATETTDVSKQDEKPVQDTQENTTETKAGADTAEPVKPAESEAKAEESSDKKDEDKTSEEKKEKSKKDSEDKDDQKKADSSNDKDTESDSALNAAQDNDLKRHALTLILISFFVIFLIALVWHNQQTFADKQTKTKTNTSNTVYDDNKILQLVHLGGYTGLQVDVIEPTVKDEEIQAQIDDLVKDAGGVFISTNGPIKNNDRLVADIVQVDPETEEPKEDTLDSDVNLLMDDTLVGSFKVALTGANVGDSVLASISSDETGEIVYRITVKSIESPSDEITDEFVKGLGIQDVSTVKELRQSISDFILKYKQENLLQNIRIRLLQMATENTEIEEIPDTILTQYKENLYNQAKQEAEERNAKAKEEAKETGEEAKTVTADDILNEQKTEAKYDGTLAEYIHDRALVDITQNLTVLKIAEKEKIEPNPAYIYSQAALDWEEHKDLYPTLIEYISIYGTSQYELGVTREAVMDFLYENAEINRIEREKSAVTETTNLETSSTTTETTTPVEDNTVIESTEEAPTADLQGQTTETPGTSMTEEEAAQLAEMMSSMFAPNEDGTMTLPESATTAETNTSDAATEASSVATTTTETSSTGASTTNTADASTTASSGASK